MTKRIAVFIGITILLISLLGFMTAVYYLNPKQGGSNTSAKGNVLDVNGCDITAGYYFDTGLRKCVKSWKTKDIKQTVVATVLQKLTAQNKLPDKGMYLSGVQLYKNEGDYDVYFDTGDGRVLAVKTRNGVMAEPELIDFSGITE